MVPHDSITRTSLLSDALDLLVNTVHPAGAKCLKETHERHHEVDVVVDRVQPVETSVCAVHDGQEKRNKAVASAHLPLWCVLEVLRVRRHCEDTLKQGKSGVKAEKEEIEKQETDPMNTAGKGTQNDRPCAED
jgi:hypothetical protein